MGLCKCPKKKVTNLFCFEHRVNVCEHCLVANHQRCIVKSYLQWLQDSDYNALCSLCNQELSKEECGECVRLTCYDVFHWECLNSYAQQLPSTTAPAGYTCPLCKSGIFPAQNMVSPVIDSLKELLSKVNWARAGLGLPLIEEKAPQPSPPATQSQTPMIYSSVPAAQSTPLKSDTSSLLTGVHSPDPLGSSPLPNHTRPSAHVTPTISTKSSLHSVISVDAGTSVRGQEKAYGVADPRKLFDSTKEDTLFNLSHDHDENKYKRRSALEWLGRWLKSREGKHKKKDPNALRKKFLMVLVIGIIGFITVIIIFSKLGRDATDNDPFLDPMANPNIRVNEKPGKILMDS